MPDRIFELLDRISRNFNEKLHEIRGWNYTPYYLGQFANGGGEFMALHEEVKYRLAKNCEKRESWQVLSGYAGLEEQLILQVIFVTLYMCLGAVAVALQRLPENVLRRSWFLDVTLATIHQFDVTLPQQDNNDIPTNLQGSATSFCSGRNVYLPHQIVIIQTLLDVLAEEFDLESYHLYGCSGDIDATGGQEVYPTIIPTMYRIALAECLSICDGEEAKTYVVIDEKLIEKYQEAGYETKAF